jgi:hypothetical protein
MAACCTSEYWVDILAYMWDLFKFIIVYFGIYINLCPCMNVYKKMNLRGKTIVFKHINIIQYENINNLKNKNIQFMKLLIYFWSSKYTDKDFNTFIKLLNRHIPGLSNTSFTLIINISQQRHDIRINVDLRNCTVNTNHITDKLLVCTHEIEDSYGFDLIDILDFAIGRDVCDNY